jgi:hypothetical protein
MDDRTCCCPSRPVVKVLSPPTADRTYQVEMLLCGHHFRVSQWALASSGAAAHAIPSQPAEQASQLRCSRPAEWTFGPSGERLRTRC